MNPNSAAALERRSAPDGLLLKGTLLATSTLTVMAGATIAPALPAMQAAFGDVANIAFWVRLVLTLPALFIVIGAPIAGYIVDRFGRKSLLAVSAILYGIAGGSGVLAPTLLTILIGRAFLGLAVAGVMTSVTTLIADYYSGKARAQFLGLQAACMGFGGTIFLSLGGVLADMDWRAPFLIYLAAFLVLPFIVTVLYEPRRTAPSEPVQPLSDAGDCVAEARRFGQGDARERSSREQVPVRLMIFIYAIVVLFQIVFYIVPVQLPFYLQMLTGATASQSGLAIAGMALFFAIASALFGWFNQRLSHITVLILAFVMVGSAYILIGLASGWALLALALPLGGFGIGILMPNLNVWLADETPAALRGRSLGGYTTSVFLGQFLSPIVTQPVSNGFGLVAMFEVVGVALLVLGSVVLLLRKYVMRLTARP